MITKNALYEAKEVCSKLKDSGRIILKGDSNILLTSNIYSSDNLDKNGLDALLEKKYANIALLNVELYNYLDAYLYLLHRNNGVNVIINYLGSHLDYLDTSDLGLYNLYQDNMIKSFIKNSNIDGLFHFVNADRISPDDINIFESMSSFSCLGLTGISKNLEPYLNSKDLCYHFQFGGSPGIDEFKQMGYRFTDDTILFNKFILDNEVLSGDKLDRSVMWPRTLRFAFSSRDITLDKRVELFNLIEEYLNLVKKELSEKGVYDALEPMQKRKVIIP